MPKTTRAPEPHVSATATPNEMSPVQVAREFNVSAATVRRWEEAGILAPSRRLPGSGYRRYNPADVDALKKRIADGDASLQRQAGENR